MNAQEEIIVVYGTTWCPDCLRAKRILENQRSPYRWVDIGQNPEAVKFVQQVNHGMRRVPTIVFPDGSILVEPSNTELLGKLAKGNP